MNTYREENGTLTRIGSFEAYNRVLYGGHEHDDAPERFFTFAGDVPLFMGASSDYQTDSWCYQAKKGVLKSGLALTPGHREGGSRDIFSKWFHESPDVIVEWRHGYLEYELTAVSAYFPSVKVKITVLPLNPDEGYLVHYDITTDQRIIWCAGLGGITGFFGRFEYHHSLNRNLSMKDMEGNHAVLHGGYASITGPGNTTMLVGDNFDAVYELDSGEAMMEDHPSLFLTGHGGEETIVKMHRVISANERLQGDVVVLHNGTSGRLQELLRPGVVTALKGKIIAKYAPVTFKTPDRLLDMTVPDTLIANDASYHGNSFYHGAIGYHAPFLGWRGWYAPALAGWRERVKSAVLTHFGSIIHSDLPEKVWYDGADRPDLDHEGTQYHHLENTSGRLPAMLTRDDIYDMQEVAIDMTLYYFDMTGDLETAEKIYDLLLETLDWQERILDPDGDGLYQNFLNTWISDGHCYNGAGCAQASCYNLRANLRSAALGKRLGRDVKRLEKRAEKIRRALVERLWLESEGIMAESMDTVGNRLIHPSPELSTIYLAVECDAVDTMDAARMLLWAKRNIRQIVTRGSRRGKLYYSSQWLPKKYSTCGLFPAENAALALAMFKTGMASEAMEIINGLADAYELTSTPGSLHHIVSDMGAPDAGDIDFTDVSSCYLRVLFEGLWGVNFRRIDGRLILAPQIPDKWDSASLTLPDVAMTLWHEPICDILAVSCAFPGEKMIVLPMRYGVVEQLFVNGVESAFEIVTGMERGRIHIRTAATGRIEIKVCYGDAPLPELVNTEVSAIAGEHVIFEVKNGSCDEIFLPGGFVGKGGNRVAADEKIAGEYHLLVRSGYAILPCKVNVQRREPEHCDNAGLQSALKMVPMQEYFNVALTGVHDRKFISPRPAGYSIGVRINGRYAWEWNHYGHNALRVEDTLLRSAGGIFTLPSGISFLTPQEGNNTLAVSIWDNFPTAAAIPLEGTAKKVHLFFCGTTNAMQSKVINARCTVIYHGGSEQTLDLIQPDNFDDFLIPSYQREAEVFYISDGTHGLHLAINTDENRRLRELRMEAIANEVIFMLLGITLE